MADSPAEFAFQSSFELTGYITLWAIYSIEELKTVSKLFRAYGLYNDEPDGPLDISKRFQSSFELTGYITYALWKVHEY